MPKEGAVTEIFDWSAAVFIIGADGVVAVRKRARDGSWGPWHLPGGKREPYELSVKETALRELTEETGIRANAAPFKILGHTPRVTFKHRKGTKKPYKHYYELFFCAVTLEQVEASLLRSFDPYEQVRLIPFEEYRRMRDFFGLHRRFIKQYGLVPDTRKAA